MPELTLYTMDTCSYCQKVLRFLKQNDITVPVKNTENSSYRQELLKIGGKTQTPCLVVDGKAVYESEDIIAWFKKNWKMSQKAQ